MSLGEIEKLVKEKGMTKEEQIQNIRKERCCLLERIHGKEIKQYKLKSGGIYHELPIFMYT